MDKNNYWYNKNVFITGINGFIGGNLTKALLNLGANVFGLVRNKKPNTFLFFEELDSKVTLIDGDLVNKDLLTRIISEERINNVFHLAAQAEVGVGITNPYLTYETNIKGTYCLMEAIRLMPSTIESVVCASSDKCYGSYGREKMPYKEDYPLKPRYPYDVSKACADMIAQSYASEIYHLPIVITRFCNIFGPGQLNFSALIPNGIRSALGYSTFIPRGDGSQVRDFIFVEDVVELYLTMGSMLAQDSKKLAGEIFNAGNNQPISVRNAIETIFFQVGNEKDCYVVLEQMKDKETTGEIDCQYMDFEKVKCFFGWKPRHTFEQGIDKTIEWFKQYIAFRAKDYAR